jgi:hypothetical protein
MNKRDRESLNRIVNKYGAAVTIDVLATKVSQDGDDARMGRHDSYVLASALHFAWRTALDIEEAAGQ